MPTPTYDLISSTTLAAASSEVVFGSLPQTYRDLVLVINGTASSNGGNYLFFNGDEVNANYSRVTMAGNGSSALTFATSNPYVLDMATSQSTVVAQIMDYSATDKHTTVLTRGGSAAWQTTAQASRWANTSAVTSLKVKTDGAITIGSGTTFNLFGIAS